MISEPNATLYVKNIDWKIKKGLLKRALYALFTRHGKVLELIVLRRDGLRGQAWIVMDTVQGATAALQAEQGFLFFGKELQIEYAKEKSDRIAKRDGTYVPRKATKVRNQQQKEKEQEQQEIQKSEGMDSQIEGGEGDTNESTAEGAADTSAPAAEGGEQQNSPGTAVAEEAPLAPPHTAAATAESASAPPSKFLLAQDLPAECNEMMLGMLFRQYAGFKEVRMPRAGLAFVEFEGEPHATLALKGLHGFKLTASDVLRLTYGKS